MAKHVISPRCPKCQEILYATIMDPILRQWFEDLQVRQPEVHISCAYRGKKEQDKHFREGLSKAKFGESPHNYKPTMALDLFFLINGKGDFDMKRYKEIADKLPPEIEWGGSWKKFKDGPHFERKGWKALVKNYPKGNREES